MQNKLDVFADELGYIQDKSVREFTKKCILKTPDYFYIVPASSTGKYHPEYSLGEGGLIRHTKALVYFAKELLSLEHNKQKFSPLEQDIIIAAGILHDSFKHGDKEQQYSVANHPVVAADHIIEFADKDEIEIAKQISDCVRSHMGEWNTDYRTKKPIMPKPQTEIEKFLHECDYLASRKPVTVKFDNYYNPTQIAVDFCNLIDRIIKLCKERIAVAKDKENLRSYLYDIIAALNYGDKNPHHIYDTPTAKRVLKAIEDYGSEEHIPEGTSGLGVIYADINC